MKQLFRKVENQTNTKAPVNQRVNGYLKMKMSLQQSHSAAGKKIAKDLKLR